MDQPNLRKLRFSFVILSEFVLSEVDGRKRCSRRTRAEVYYDE